MFCAECGKKLEVTEPVSSVESKVPSIKSAVPRKTIVIVSIIVFIIFFSMFGKVIPVLKSRVVQEPYTYSYQVLEWKPVHDVIYQETVSLTAYSSYGSGWHEKSKSFYLGKNWEIKFTQDPDTVYVSVGLIKEEPPWDRGIGIASSNAILVTAESGQYHVYCISFDNNPSTFTVEVLVTAKLETTTKTGSGTINVNEPILIYYSVMDWILNEIFSKK